MTVVAGTDFSTASARAVDAAAALAAAWKSDLVLVHALEVPGAEEAGTWSLLEAERSRSQAKLAEEAARVAKSGVKARTELGLGAGDVALVQAASNAGAKLVVVGALGRRGGSLWRLGSTADRVAQSSRVPVLVVRDAAPIAEWAGGRRPLQVLVGVDKSPSSDAALAWLGELERIAACRVTGGHVYWPPDVAGKGGMHIGEANAEVEKALAVELRARVEAVRPRKPIELRFLGGLGRPADHLVRMAEEAKADLLVVGANHRNLLSRLWHGSVSRGVIEQAPMNVACVGGGA